MHPANGIRFLDQDNVRSVEKAFRQKEEILSQPKAFIVFKLVIGKKLETNKSAS